MKSILKCCHLHVLEFWDITHAANVVQTTDEGIRKYSLMVQCPCETQDLYSQAITWTNDINDVLKAAKLINGLIAMSKPQNQNKIT